MDFRHRWPGRFVKVKRLWIQRPLKSAAGCPMCPAPVEARIRHQRAPRIKHKSVIREKAYLPTNAPGIDPPGPLIAGHGIVVVCSIDVEATAQGGIAFESGQC